MRAPRNGNSRWNSTVLGKRGKQEPGGANAVGEQTVLVIAQRRKIGRSGLKARDRGVAACPLRTLKVWMEEQNYLDKHGIWFLGLLSDGLRDGLLGRVRGIHRMAWTWRLNIAVLY